MTLPCCVCSTDITGDCMARGQEWRDRTWYVCGECLHICQQGGPTGYYEDRTPRHGLEVTLALIAPWGRTC